MTKRRDFLATGCSLVIAHAVEGSIGTPDSPQPRAVAAGDPLGFVNPELRGPLKMMLPGSNGPKPAFDAAAVARMLNPRPDPTPAVTEHMIPGGNGDPDVRVYVTGDAPSASKPAILHIHGGGYTAMSAAMSIPLIQGLARRHDCVAVTVDYRLAPKTRFPGSLEDNYAALRWIYANAQKLGVDTKRVAVKGESAGGGHAAALAIAVRDRKEFALCLQVLEFPMLDDRTGSSNQLPPQFGKFIWTPESNRAGWTALLGVPAGSDRVPEGAVPSRVKDLSGLPPTFIGVGSIDLFAPENVEYAQRLMLAGNHVELHVVPGAFHAFGAFAPDASISKQYGDAVDNAIRRAFAEPWSA